MWVLFFLTHTGMLLVSRSSNLFFGGYLCYNFWEFLKRIISLVCIYVKSIRLSPMFSTARSSHTCSSSFVNLFIVCWVSYLRFECVLCFSQKKSLVVVNSLLSFRLYSRCLYVLQFCSQYIIIGRQRYKSYWVFNIENHFRNGTEH